MPAPNKHDFATLKALAAQLGWKFALDGEIATLRRDRSAIGANVSLEEGHHGLVYFTCRTTSWDFPGDRTDIHDVVSVSVSALVATRREATFRLIDVENPAVPIEREIYARLLVPAQPAPPFFDLSAVDSPLRPLLRVTAAAEQVVWWTLFSSPHSPGDVHEPVEHADDAWTERVLEALGGTDADPLTAHRHLPSWTYYRSPRGTSVVENENLASTLAAELPAMDVQIMREGVFVRMGALEHRIPTATYHRTLRALRRLGALGTNATPAVIPIENRLVVAAGAFMITVPCDCGRTSFDHGRRRAVERLADEASLLLSATRFSWASKIPPDRFEALIHELLRVSRQVVWVRAVGPTNERDRSRDFLAQWIHTTPALSLSEKVPPSETIPVIVQCKVRSRTVGKKDVTDIVDTIELNGAAGYFLAASTQLSADLVDQLHKLRGRNRWMIDWWTKPEIEDALRRHSHVAARYQDIVRKVE